MRLELTLDRATMRLSLEPFGSTDMNVTVEIFPDRLAACLRHVGSYDHAGPTYERLLRWAASAELLDLTLEVAQSILQRVALAASSCVSASSLLRRESCSGCARSS